MFVLVVTIVHISYKKKIERLVGVLSTIFLHLTHQKQHKLPFKKLHTDIPVAYIYSSLFHSPFQWSTRVADSQ